jgi:D-methionine transport system permease protein
MSGTPWHDVPSLLVPALEQTAQMVGITMVIVVVVGLPLGLLLFNTSPQGLMPRQKLNAVISWFANIGRSLPFLVLMAAIIPFTRWVVGTTIGIKAAIIPMTLAGIPFFARLMENGIRDVPRSLMDVGVVSGMTRLQIVRRIQLTEALPTIVAGLTLNVIAMIEYSAIAGAIGAGGLGYLAVNYGYQQFDNNIMIACIVVLVLLVQLVQFSGDRLVRTLIH